jgi:hypothetical protein
MKKKFWEKGHSFLKKVIMLTHCILFCTLDWVKDSTQMNVMKNIRKRFTISPNLVVELKCTTFEVFTTTKAI